MANMFSGVEDTEEVGSATYISAGRYDDLEIVKCAIGENRKLEKNFHIEMIVRKSSGEKAVREGATCTWLIKRSNDYFLSEVRKLCATIYGVEFEDVNEAALDELVSEKNPSAGLHLACDADEIITKEKKVTFTRVKWTHIPPKAKS